MHILVGFASAALVACGVLLVAAVRARRRGYAMHDIRSLLPNLARLLVRLWRDRTLPFSVRMRLLVALVYNAQPINVIPDFIPVVGLFDNAVVTLWALRATVHRAGRGAIERHWTGTPEALAMLLRFANIDK